MARVEIEIPPRSAYVGVVRLALASLGRTAGLDEEALDDLKIAVSEACTNAVLGHEETGLDEPVLVAWDDEGALVVEVTDRSEKQAPGNLIDSQGFSTRQVMSLALLESMAERVDIEPSATGGITTRLTFPS
jgi:anti-sigma regulatory factor (Ser/Thr protein kinase)